MNRKIEGLNKEIKEVKDQMGILELKNTVNEKKKIPGWDQQQNENDGEKSQ